MNINDYLRVAPFIHDCPKCGCGETENGQGTFEVKENIIRRSCKCGFNLEFDTNNGTTKKIIKKAIDEALTNM